MADPVLFRFKKVISGNTAWLSPDISRAMKLIGTRLNRDAGDAAFRVAELGIIRQGLP